MKYPLFLVLTFGFLFPPEIYAQGSEIDSVSNLPVEKIHEIPEIEASFPGGMLAGNKHFYNYIESNRKVLNADGRQFCHLKFIVDTEGNISDIRTNKSVETKLDEVVIKALKASPKWIPARNNGVKVNAYASLTFIFEPNKSRKSAYAKNSINYFVTKENKVEKQYQKILVLVAGKAPVRIFTDHFYENLKKDLERRNNIETEYIFIGNDQKSANDNFTNVIGSKKFDAILFLIQEENSKIKEKHYGVENMMGLIGNKTPRSGAAPQILAPYNYYGSEISIRSLSIKQSMNIFLIEPEDLDSSIIEARVFMNFQLKKKSAYSKAAKDFITILQENGIANTGRNISK